VDPACPAADQSGGELTPDGTIAVIGLGYVGLPLAVEFGKARPVIGFDIKPDRIAELRAGRDHTREVPAGELAEARHLTFTSDPGALREARVFIVTVPTPIDAHKRPDLGPLLRASQTVGRALKPGDLVIYESTVYPGATEEDCVPVLEAASGLRFNRDFFCGYSPERINPGDRAHRLTSIVKVTSGSTPEAAARVDALYASIVTAGTYRAPSIRVAEAAKVIENTQRDLNIALMNELAIIFARIGIDTAAVLAAAGTKWNFLPFRPGLVGGHCIGVDPYYLTHKAEALGYHPQVILAGRRINDGMGAYVAGQLVKLMLRRGMAIAGARALVLGLTFKENCPDLRNTRVVDVITELRDFGMEVDVHDPWADPAEARAEYGLEIVAAPAAEAYDAVVLAVPHEALREGGAARLRGWGRPGHVFFDLKSVFEPGESDLRV
jgi:UDP-N-acetyl-D-galactosamine dehydrogenase